jgi:hypothetical protein
MIFCALAMFLLFVEMGAWKETHTHHKGKVWLGRFLLVVETVNALRLVWILLAQITGVYKICSCKAST